MIRISTAGDARLSVIVKYIGEGLRSGHEARSQSTRYKALSMTKLLGLLSINIGCQRENHLSCEYWCLWGRPRTSLCFQYIVSIRQLQRSPGIFEAGMASIQNRFRAAVLGHQLYHPCEGNEQARAIRCMERGDVHVKISNQAASSRCY